MKRLLLFILLFSTWYPIFSQDNIIYHRYKNEPGQQFQFEKFQRGFEPEEVKKELDHLVKKDKNDWNVNDSLLFATSLLKIGNSLKAAVIFNKIPSPFIRDMEILQFKLMAFEKTQNFGLAINLIEELAIRFPYDQMKWEIWKKMLQARATIKNGKKIDFKDFDFVPEILNLNESQKIEIVEEINSLLHFMIQFYEDNDKIIARLCFDMGVILRDHFSYTQAYIAFSLARNYDKKTSLILKKLKEVKGEMSANKYKLPAFRRYFPRIKKGRFEYSILKDKKNNKDSSLNEPVQLMKPKDEKKELLPYNQNIILAIGCLVILLLSLIILRTKK